MPGAQPPPDLSPRLVEDEPEKVQRWQVLMLLELGFSIDQALLLVSVRGFTWHDARELRERGFAHALVVEILT